MKIKVWLGMTLASLLLIGGGLLSWGAVDGAAGENGSHFFAGQASWTDQVGQKVQGDRRFGDQTEPPEPMGMLDSVDHSVSQTEPPEPMAPSIVG